MYILIVKSVYDQLHSRPKHPTVQNNSEPTPANQPEHASQPQDLSSPPTRSHWTRDENTTNCTSCTLKFTILIRKHHCRKCGQIFCSECSKYSGKLDSNAHFHPFGYLCRLCISCHQGFIVSLDGKICSDEGGLIDSPSTGNTCVVKYYSRTWQGNDRCA